MTRRISTQLVDAHSGEIIAATGGFFKVCKANSPDPQAIALTPAATPAITNSLQAMTAGKIEFHLADDVESVDLCILAPGGQFVRRKGIRPAGPSEIEVNTQQPHQLAVIPFSHEESTATVEKDTGFDLPVGAIVLSDGVGIDVVDTDATETLDFGILASETGDADGFGVGLSVATAGTVKATLANGAVTKGALLKVQDSANAGDAVPEGHVIASGKQSVSYTSSAGSDTYAGFLLLPYLLANVG